MNLFKDKRNFKRSDPRYKLYKKILEKTNGKPNTYIPTEEDT